MEPIQMQISKKKKLFLDFFCKVLNPGLNFEHFLKKDDTHS